MSHYEPDYDAPKPCRHCGRTRDHHRLNTGECVVPPAPASGGQCIRPERSEVNAPAVGSHVTSPEARGDGSGDRRDGGPDAPRKLCSCTALGLGAPAGRCPKCGGWQECHPCTGPGYCAEHGCIKTRASAPPPPAPAPEGKP